MKPRMIYGLKLGVLIGGLGGAVFFVWSILTNSLIASLYSALSGFIALGILGFILGILIFNLE